MTTVIFVIIEQIILPIVLMIGVGFILHRKFEFHMNTFSKLLFYFYIPALTFVKIYEAKASPDIIAVVLGFIVLQFVSLYVITLIVSKVCGYDSALRAAFSNSVVLTNNGNVGIPVNDLAFHHNPFAMSIQMVVLLFEILVTFTFGVANAKAAWLGIRSVLMQFFSMPIFHCLILGMLFNAFQLKVPDFIWIPLTSVSNGMLSFALVSIGAQIASVKNIKNTSAVLLSSALRLLVSPLLAFCLISALGFQGILAQALWIASSMPTSRNSAALALEYNNEPEFAAQTVLVSTLLSSATLTLVVYLSGVLFQA